ncbi:oligosaccharide flippase family protein [Candidatus Marithrix sp. Canyon 246]|uniref:oligosaccharide flippase family protein n=1 Tax=Candidatus Marithrix sp. Canyon 246 TaxID=1827136 RepID=UPI00209B936B|nr:oligosaccharide flippase family protein [Candidatus Marithrix sp. Canyon 246]
MLFSFAAWANYSFSLVVLLGLGMLLLSLTTLLNGIFRSLERLDLEAKIGIIQKIWFFSASLIGVALLEQGMLWVAAAYFSSHLIGLSLTFVLIIKYRWFNLCYSSYNIKYIYSHTWPLFIAAFLTVLSVRIEIFLLQYFHGEQAVAIYSAVIRLMDGLVILSTAYMAAVFPRLVALVNQISQFIGLFKHSLLILFVSSTLVVIIAYILTPWGINFLYGEDYNRSIIVLQTLLPILPILFIAALLGQVLVALERQKWFMIALSIALGFSVVIDVFTIPYWYELGAVIGYWSRELVLFLLLSFLVYQALHNYKKNYHV